MQVPNMRKGQIMLWYGSLASIPSGWHLCNGDMNTPDLRNLWVIGAGNNYDPDDTGGTTVHAHAYGGPLHTHTIESGGSVGSGSGFGSTSDQSRIVGTSDYWQHRPPYKALAYIQKIN